MSCCSTHAKHRKRRKHFKSPVHTYPDIFESATFSFQIRLPSTTIRRIRQRIRKKINPLSRVEKNISATNPITCGRGQSGKKLIRNESDNVWTGESGYLFDYINTSEILIPGELSRVNMIYYINTSVLSGFLPLRKSIYFQM